MDLNFEEILDQRFTATLCSRVANNHCLLCSFFAPTNKDHEWWNYDEEYNSPLSGYKSATTCPSCGRGCYRYFLPENAKPLDYVPDDYVTRLHGDPDKLLALPDPKFVRSCYSREVWHEKLREAKRGASEKRVSSPEDRFVANTPVSTVDSSGMGTPMKGMRLKF